MTTAGHMTDEMAHLLRVLGEYTSDPTTRRLADNLERPSAGRSYWGYDRTHSMLKRMAKRGLVSRDGRRPAHWSITEAGVTALREHDAA